MTNRHRDARTHVRRVFYNLPTTAFNLFANQICNVLDKQDNEIYYLACALGQVIHLITLYLTHLQLQSSDSGFAAGGQMFRNVTEFTVDMTHKKTFIITAIEYQLRKFKICPKFQSGQQNL